MARRQEQSLMGRWDSSTRRASLPPDWARRRAAVRDRAEGRCECTGCDQHAGRCHNPGTDCDHTGDRLDHSLDSLAWLCHPCHEARTREQGRRARQAQLNKLRHPSARALPPGLR